MASAVDQADLSVVLLDVLSAILVVVVKVKSVLADNSLISFGHVTTVY
jgi:hypothetical protein